MTERGTDAVTDGAFDAVSVADTEAPGRGSLHEGYRSMFESSPLPMYVLDLSTLRFLEANDAAVRHYGYTREELLKMSAADLWPSEDAGKNREVAAHPLPLARRVRGVASRETRGAKERDHVAHLHGDSRCAAGAAPAPARLGPRAATHGLMGHTPPAALGTTSWRSTRTTCAGERPTVCHPMRTP
jgi:PAS domain S-box-containing protein